MEYSHTFTVGFWVDGTTEFIQTNNTYWHYLSYLPYHNYSFSPSDFIRSTAKHEDLFSFIGR